MSKKLTVDLTLLNKLVAELAAAIAGAETRQLDSSYSSNDYVIDMSKAIGLATGVVLEGSALTLDLQAVIKAASTPDPKGDSLNSLLGILKAGEPSSKN